LEACVDATWGRGGGISTKEDLNGLVPSPRVQRGIGFSRQNSRSPAALGMTSEKDAALKSWELAFPLKVSW
jgi:hypothetical protein